MLPSFPALKSGVAEDDAFQAFCICFSHQGRSKTRGFATASHNMENSSPHHGRIFMTLNQNTSVKRMMRSSRNAS